MDVGLLCIFIQIILVSMLLIVIYIIPHCLSINTTINSITTSNVSTRTTGREVTFE